MRPDGIGANSGIFFTVTGKNHVNSIHRAIQVIIVIGIIYRWIGQVNRFRDQLPRTEVITRGIIGSVISHCVTGCKRAGNIYSQVELTIGSLCKKVFYASCCCVKGITYLIKQVLKFRLGFGKCQIGKPNQYTNELATAGGRKRLVRTS